MGRGPYCGGRADHNRTGRRRERGNKRTEDATRRQQRTASRREMAIGRPLREAMSEAPEEAVAGRRGQLESNGFSESALILCEA
jgi:hypothetical protein